MPSSLFCLGSHRVFKSMHPTKFLGCNSWTLPFPIPAGGQGSPGLQRPRSRAGPAGQSSGFCPLDFQRTLHCWKYHAALSFPQRGEAAKALTPKARPFCHCQVGEPREWSTWFPAPRSPSSLTCGPHPSAEKSQSLCGSSKQPSLRWKSKGQNPELWPAGPALLLTLCKPAGP